MRILFLSHSYPPILGGIENQNYDLSQHLSKISDTTIIANKKGKKALLLFLVFSFVRSFFVMSKNDVCLCGSGILAPLAMILKFFHPRKHFYCVVHGLDITYATKKGILPFIYRIVNIPSLKSLDKLFMVGNATIEEAVRQGIDRKKCVFIPNGVDPKKLLGSYSRKDLQKLLQKNVSNKKVILRLGRFVPHKGTSWFINNIVPLLPEDIVFVAAGNRVSKNTAGDKDDFPVCQRAVEKNNLQDKVVLLPSIEWESVRTLLNTVDLVVSPNIKIAGAMEGFGINVIEAGICGRVVIASKLEGIADAIADGKNGIFTESENVEAWNRKILAVLDAGEEFSKQFGKRATDYVRENYSWNNIAQKYLEEMK